MSIDKKEQTKEFKMFEIGDRVELVGFDRQIFGRILSYRYDEGNVWEVVTDGGNRWDCCDDDLILSLNE